MLSRTALGADPGGEEELTSGLPSETPRLVGASPRPPVHALVKSAYLAWAGV